MPDTKIVADHYTQGSSLDAIRAGVERLGKSPGTISVRDLGAVDEFHIGGRMASERFLDQLGLSEDDTVLDVGCGIGGTSRFVAERYGSRVTGIDLTDEFIDVGRVLCEWVRLDDRVALEQGSATAMPYADGRFDKAFMLHVGMNIADKRTLMTELYRVLKPGATLGVYDVMATTDDALAYPVPWASTAAGSAVASPEDYKAALVEAGFRLVAEQNRRDFALKFFKQMKESVAAADRPPPLGLHILMGETAPLKVKNMIENISEGRVAPVELIAEKQP